MNRLTNRVHLFIYKAVKNCFIGLVLLFFYTLYSILAVLMSPIQCPLTLSTLLPVTTETLPIVSFAQQPIDCTVLAVALIMIKVNSEQNARVASSFRRIMNKYSISSDNKINSLSIRE